jgi:hypothetical protein
MGLNVYLGLLVEVDSATLISTILLVDVKVESFSPYIYVPTLWVKHIKTTVRGAPSLGNLSVVNYIFFSRRPTTPPGCLAQAEVSTMAVREHTFYSKEEE